MASSDAVPQTEYIKYVPEPGTMKRIGKFHTRLYRLTGGLIGGRIDGLDILLLTTVGRKSGEKRTVPLPYYRDGGRYLLVASFGGNAKNPAWVHNLTANPGVQIQVGFRKIKAQAMAAEEPERNKLWEEIATAFPRYRVYQQKTERTIPVIVLEPAR